MCAADTGLPATTPEQGSPVARPAQPDVGGSEKLPQCASFLEYLGANLRLGRLRTCEKRDAQTTGRLTIDSVVRFPMQVRGRASVDGVHQDAADATIEVDIGVNANSRCCNTRPLHLPISLTAQQEALELVQIAARETVAVGHRVTPSPRMLQRPATRPHFLPFFIGVLHGLVSRLSLGEVYENTPETIAHLLKMRAVLGGNGKPDTQRWPWLHCGATLFADTPNEGYPPGARFGAFPAVAYADAYEPIFDPYACLVVMDHEMVADKDNERAIALLSLLRQRLDPEFRRLLEPIIFMAPEIPAHYAGPDILRTQADVDAALRGLERWCAAIYGSWTGVARYYYIAGAMSIMRPHSCYSEGGILRKLLFHPSLTQAEGIYTMPVIRGGDIFGYQHGPHRGIRAVIAGLALTLSLQSVVSHSGPKVVHFPHHDALWGRAGLPASFPARPEDRVIQRTGEVCMVANFMRDVMAREHEARLWGDVLQDFFGDSVAVLRVEIDASFANSKAKVQRVVASRKVDAQGRPRQYKCGIAFINRFHDPEFALTLAARANGIGALAGRHEIDLCDALQMFLGGCDIRQLPVLTFLPPATLEKFVMLVTEAIPGLHILPQVQYLDGRVVFVEDTASPTVLQGWSHDTLVKRPYSTWVTAAVGVRARPLNPVWRGHVVMHIETATDLQLRGRAYSTKVTDCKDAGGSQASAACENGA